MLTADNAGGRPDLPSDGARRALSDGFLSRLDATLASTDAFLAAAFPGDDGRRQPVHTVYVPADRFTPDLPQQWGRTALDLVQQQGGIETVCRLAGLSDEHAAEVGPRVLAKLEGDPIEDLRLDFEDGYGTRADDQEDRDSVSAAQHVVAALESGQAPAWVGVRFKSFEAATRHRGVRTLDLFLGGLLQAHGTLPEGLVLTFPKVSTVSQVEAMVTVCEQLEQAHALPSGRLRFEIQVETPQLIVGADGRIPVAEAIHAGGGRVSALHYGTYDYSASLQISAEYQASDHPAADFAKQVMQVAVAGTPVHLSDGSTNLLPVGSAEHVHRAWAVHAALVRRALERGFYQGWDLHPGQLPTRYAATFGFYREGAGRAAQRLRDYLVSAETDVMDEPATARALARYLQRGHDCGAIDDAELVAMTGLTAAQVGALARPRSDTKGVVPKSAAAASSLT
jgi:citrate lyase beta subunit